VLHDAAVGGTDAAAASQAVRDVVASVRTSQPRASPEVAVHALPRGARPPRPESRW
jgi:hypothetical protein